MQRILGPLLFKIFLYELFLYIKEVKIHSFIGDNTIYVEKKDIENPRLLEQESEPTVTITTKNTVKFLVWKFCGKVSALFRAIRGNCAFLKTFHTKKLGIFRSERLQLIHENFKL